jgi:hypothetical protein
MYCRWNGKQERASRGACGSSPKNLGKTSVLDGIRIPALWRSERTRKKRTLPFPPWVLTCERGKKDLIFRVLTSVAVAVAAAAGS